MLPLHPRPVAVAPRTAGLIILSALAAMLLGLAPSTPAAAQVAPRLAYGTFLGGASDDVANAVATDAQGNIYLAGYSYSQPFPGTTGSRQDTNAFVTKLDPSGKTVLYSTLIGGSDDEEGLALAVDAAGNAWLTGFTQSDDLPLLNALQTTPAGDDDTFVSKLDPSGAPLLQTYLGMPGSDRANAIALDPQGNAYLAGQMAGNFGPQVRVAKLTADGSSVAYDVAFGAASRGFAKGSSARAIAVDAAGNAYLAGKTNTGAFETEGFQARCVGYDNPIDDCPSDDGFVVVLNAAASNLIGGTLLGGLGNDEATGVALDPAGNLYVTGTTFSADFPTKNAWQAQKRGPDNFAEAFLLKLAPLAASLTYGTYYGGDAYDEGHALTVDRAGRAYLTGLTSSTDLAVPGALQPTISGLCVTGATTRMCYDAFVASFDAAGALSWASYIGGTDDDLGNSVALAPGGDLYLAGRADSFTLPVTPDALQARRRGGDDAFLTRISTGAPEQPQRTFRVNLPMVRS